MLDRFAELVGGLDHPEGVAWGPDGRVHAGGEAGQIYAVTLDGRVEERATTGGFMYGVALDGDGNVYACDYGNGNLVRLSSDGTLAVHSTGTPDRPIRVPNFAAFDDGGSLFVTDSGEWGADDGVVFRISPDGETRVWSDAHPAFPNGCCLTEAGDALLLVESRARRVVRIPVEDDGSPGRSETVADLSGSQPDGIALASDGTMFVGCYRPDRIYRVAPDGSIEVWADDPDGVVLNQPANVAFVGAELDRIVVSSLGGWSLMIADAGVTGLPLRYPKLG
jgi:gluconolactonase